MTDATIYVPSLPTRWDAATQGQVPTLDLNPATEFGSLSIITRGPQSTGDELDDAIGEAIGRARRYNYDAGDAVLMVGDPILNAAFISAAAGDNYQPVRCLRWDRKTHSYNEVDIRL